ncbi:MAG TPA: hypothetical protein VNZ45_03375 [Bacteroidia bacterium]|jgi:hypothetical protein|nr:hypothetical protein [Bacteroidia bacterium]
MKPLNKVVTINLLILLAYSLIIRLVVGRDEKSLGILLTSALIIFCHIFILILAGLILQASGKKELGRAFLLSSVFVLVIGFGVCWGNATM